MNLRKSITSALALMMLSASVSVFAASVDHYKITLNPLTAKVGESLDITIEAMDKNNEVVTDYTGTSLMVSETDAEAVLPDVLKDNLFEFKEADQGSIKFENSIKFSKAGEQSISVIDFNDDLILGKGSALISEDEVEKTEEITITSPTNGLTIGGTSIKVSGTTKKNHSVELTVNDSEKFKTISSEEGIYEVELKDLKNGNTTIYAEILDADKNVVGKSEKVSINIDSKTPSLKNITLSSEELDSEASYAVTIISDKNLEKVSVIINDVLTDLEENEPGIYTASLYAPKEKGEYKIDVSLRNELGLETKELGVGTLKVNEVIIVKEEIKEELNAGAEEDKSDDKKDLEIKNLKLVELKTKSILTWDKVEEAEGYNVYKEADKELELIEEVDNNRFEIAITGDELKYDYFVVKAIGKTASGEIYESKASDRTKVKTGPEVVILLLIALLIGGFMFISRKQS